MAGAIEVSTHSGPIRIRVSSSAPVKVRALNGPIAIKLLGMPGPQGPAGTPGAPGQPGATGNLEAGIVIDGGNF